MTRFDMLTRSAALSALVLALGFTAPASAKVSEFDANGDAYVDMDEFHAGTEASFRSQDTDGDSRMSEDEFRMRFNNDRDDFKSFDADGDGYLTNDEFNAGMYGRYDQDGDGRLDVNESGEFDASVGDYTRPHDADTIIEDTDKLNIKAN